MIQVLIVDDSATVRLMLRQWLEAASYPVLEAADGLQALEVLRAATEPLVVLLDYQMPKLDGYEVLRIAAAEGLLPPRFAYVVISSVAHDFPVAFSAMLRQLSIQILPKPFDSEQLLAVTAFVAERLRSLAPTSISPQVGS
jgi:CheY-like chemotaxis protein